MLGGDINILMDIWALDKAKHNDIAPFESVEHMYKVFDATKVGDVPWKCFMTSFDGKVTETPASWEHNEYQIWYHDPDVVLHNLLDNPDFDGQFDYQPYIEWDKNVKQCWDNMMSGNFAWHHSVSPESISI